jgi:ribosomal protein S18 acetylase RimI-like enzyme
VALEGSELLGFIYAETEPDFFDRTLRGYVSSLAVAKHVQGRGVGKALLEAAESWVRGMGYDYLTLTVFAGNGQARGFYDRLGYLEDNIKLYKPLTK